MSDKQALYDELSKRLVKTAPGNRRRVTVGFCREFGLPYKTTTGKLIDPNAVLDENPECPHVDSRGCGPTKDMQGWVMHCRDCDTVWTKPNPKPVQ